MKRITIKCPYCPCMFGSELDFQAHLRGFGDGGIKHFRKFVEIHNLSSDRKKRWAQKYLKRDKI